MPGIICRGVKDMRQRIEFVAMRDGVKLFTNIWMPDEPGRYPVILVRSPYDDPKNYGGGGTREGYVTIYQSCRGTAGSQGEIIAYVNERRDGLDTLAWIRRQDFYNGEIYVIGGSYLSTVHLMYLDTCPSDVRGGLLKIQDCDRYNIHYENGQYKVGLHYGWAVGNMIKRHPELAGRYDKEKAIRELPAKDFAKRLLGDSPVQTLTEAEEAFMHPDRSDPWWTTREGVKDGLKAPESIRFPLFLCTAHYDIYTIGIPRMWERLKPETRAKSMFVITPYSHGWLSGNYKFENDRSEFLSEIDGIWLDYCRTGRLPGDMQGFELGMTNCYVLFGGRWIAEEFITDGAKKRRLYLGGGRLNDTDSSGETSYTYDPDHPSSFNGNCGNVFGAMAAQHGIGTKNDVLSFLSEPFSDTVTVKGVQRLHLNVKSDCEDTAFYARMSLVRRDGTAYGIRDRITSLSYELGEGKYVPGETVGIDMAFDLTAFEIKEGERIRLDIASSYWPAYIPHNNVSGLWCEVTERRIARNTVVWEGSALELCIE